MSVDERRRIMMLKISLFVGLLSLLINKLTIAILISLYTIGVQRFKPLVKVLDMHTYPIFSTCISITGIVANLIALYMTSSAIFPHRRASQVNSMIAAQYFYFFYVISLGSASLVTGYMLESVEYTFEGGLFSSMKKYGVDQDIKVQIDLLQIRYQCCGDKSFKDWFSLQWIRHPYINLDDAIDRNELRSDGRYRTDSVPFSCCSPNILRSCIFEHINDNGIRINYNAERDHTLHPEGCRSVMIWRTKNLLAWLFASYFILGIINISLLVTFRYLLTSISEALKHGQPKAAALAYL